MLKKLISAGLVAVMALSLTACGGQKKADDKAKAATGAVKWPKNVQIIVPYGAGGDTDFNARLFAQKLSKKLGSNFVISNVNGNGGSTGSRQEKKRKKDGSIIL